MRSDTTDWDHVKEELDHYGCALTGPLLTPAEATEIKDLYKDDWSFALLRVGGTRLESDRQQAGGWRDTGLVRGFGA